MKLVCFLCIANILKTAALETLNVIIETPKGSRNKYTYNQDSNSFSLKKVLPLGMVFPFDFGFIPGTLGEDGDPLDILVLMDEPAFPGCGVACRVIGAIKAEQTKEGEVVRNDRIIAIAETSLLYKDVTGLKQLNEKIVEQMEQFFISYIAGEGETFTPLERLQAKEAMKLIG